MTIKGEIDDCFLSKTGPNIGILTVNLFKESEVIGIKKFDAFDQI